MANRKSSVTPRATARKARSAPAAAPLPPPPPPRPAWTFLTNHAHVLICLWREPDARLRDVADRVGITERAVQAIVADLEAAGVLTRQREGRRNHYEIHPNVPLRHPVESTRTVADLLGMLGETHPTS